MADFYFFKTMADKSRNRLRPLSGQFLDGVPVDITLNVQSDTVLRTTYPLGTIFGSPELKLNSGYYTSGDIFPVSLRDDEYKELSHRPSEAMKRAYESFTGLSDMAGSYSDDAKHTSDGVDTKTVLGKLMSNDKFAIASVEKDGFFVDPKIWFLLLRNINNQVNTLMIGDTGTGKTELVMLACKKLGIPCSVYDMGSMYDPVAGLLGVHRLQQGGVSTFDYAKFTQDISKPGVVLLDELSRAPVTTNNILFPCLDSRKTLPVEIAGGDDLRSVPVHPECTFVATANIGAEYSGTMSLDRALVGRFFPIELDYMPDSYEIDVIVKRCRISSIYAQHIVHVAKGIRSIFRKKEISVCVSTRETLMAGELVADGWSVLQAMEMVFLPLFEGTDSDGERGIIRKIIMSK